MRNSRVVISHFPSTILGSKEVHDSRNGNFANRQQEEACRIEASFAQHLP